MDDLISRKTTIDAVLSIGHIAKLTDGDAVIRMSAVNYVLRTLPSAEPEPHWIPVTERLPEEKQDVLIAFKHNMAVGFWEDILNDGGQAWYANSGNGWFTGTEAVDDDGYPIAWMPLPEPWKGEEKND